MAPGRSRFQSVSLGGETWGFEKKNLGHLLQGELGYRLDGLVLKYAYGLITSEYCFGCAMPSAWCLVRVQWELLPSCPDLQAPVWASVPSPHVLVLGLVSRAHPGPQTLQDHRSFFPHRRP